MKNYLVLFYLLSVLLAIISCDNPVKTDDYDSFYPLAIGNQWHYDRTMSNINIRPDSNITIEPATRSISIDIEITGTESLDNIDKAFVFTQKSEGQFGTYYGTSYYANSDNGLFLYAYKGGDGTLLPKLSTLTGLKAVYYENLKRIVLYFNNTVLPKTVLSDSIIYERSPVKVLAYPLYSDSQWLLRRNEITTVYKKVISRETVEVPAGNFDCYKIQYVYISKDNTNWSDNITFYEYVNQYGLIKRSILIKDEVLLNEQGEQIALYDFKDESVLTSYLLKQ